MEDLDEEDDVIIEGSELHRALVKMGYTDFEFTPVNKELKLNEESGRKFKWPTIPTSCFHNRRWPKNPHFFSKQLGTILSSKCLLDDHFALVQTFLDHKPSTFWNKLMEWCNIFGLSISMGIACSMSKRKHRPAALSAVFVAAIIVFHEYKQFRAAEALKNLVKVQNELYQLYKKSLSILRNVYRLRTDEKKATSKFSKLEIDRLKYLQPLTETLLRSLERAARTFYHASLTTLNLLPENISELDVLTNFDAEAFVIRGEITYEKFKQLYYVYILAQSDLLQLFAVAYDLDKCRRDEGGIPLAQLTRITVKLRDSLIAEKNRLEKTLVTYDNSRKRTNDRKFKLASASKCKDLYLNLDLLSRKLQITYDEIASILEEIEKRENEETADFVDQLAPKIQEIYTQIDKSRNFAELNNLLVAIMQRSCRPQVPEIPTCEVDFLQEESKDDPSIVRDSEPRIIDEVFEEYITEEYLKPLYEEEEEEDDDEATMQIAKLDKLLAKNFMSELKEILVEKHKSMSEREAKALLRKYPELRDPTNFKENHILPEESMIETENPDIPRPPEASSNRSMLKEKMKSRGPVPLPRARNPESPIITAPRPPPLPSILQVDTLDNAQRLSINNLLPFAGPRKIPAFLNCDEEFVGSGENSDQELEATDDSA